MKYKLFQELSWKNIKESECAPTYSSTNQKQFPPNQWSYSNKIGPYHCKQPGKASFSFQGTDWEVNESYWGALCQQRLLIPG